MKYSRLLFFCALKLLVISATFGLPGNACADDTDYGSEYYRKIEASRTLASLDKGLFGDQISNSDGQLNFSVVDVSLPGNNALPVEIRRSYDVQGAFDAPFGSGKSPPFGDWDLDIPHLQGFFTQSTGWTTGTAGILCGQSDKSLAAPPTVVSGINTLDSDTYWKGNSLYLPGQGADEILHLEDSATNKPTDGQAYHWTTKGRWYFSCLASIDDRTLGDAFLARAPDGTKYWFNHYAGRGAKTVYGALREEVWLLPTRVEDRFGNSVVYAYDPSNPWNLLSISSSDGRTISLHYPKPGGFVDSISDGSRQWKYQYAALPRLTSVILPDGSQWQYGSWWHLAGSGGALQFNGFGKSQGPPKERAVFVKGQGCGAVPFIATPYSQGGWDFIYSVAHPSGATGTFTLNLRHNVRTYVPKVCGDAQVHDSFDRFPAFYEVLGVTRKEISGPGIQSNYVWTWSYPSTPTAPAAITTYDFQCAAGCPTSKQISITQPDGSIVRNTMGVQYGINEGKLLKRDVFDRDGVSLLSTDSTDYLSNPAGQKYPSSVGDPFKLYNEPLVGVLTPAWRKQTVQQGVTFDWHVATDASGAYSFDVFANPTTEYSTSTLGFSRTRTRSYYYDLSRWVLGLPSAETDVSTNAVIEQTDYDPATALPVRALEFGLLKATMAYNADGTLATITDGNLQTTTLLSWYRGIPRKIKFADSKSKSAAVNNQGWVTGVTDENGYATGYSYDSMGRLATIAQPSNDTQADGTSISWTPTSIAYSQVSGLEYGLTAGHWKEAVTTGNASKVTYFDALWRPVMTKEFDAANPGGTTRISIKAFDAEDRETFSSYPIASVANFDDPLTGVHFAYDALGRTVLSTQSSELGPLNTQYSYLTGFVTRVTNPRGNATQTSFQAFDSPDAGHPVSIASPLNVTTNIARDVFGKPLSITRSGSFGGHPLSETRSFVYDQFQRLCKSVEPETGATLVSYDAADNILWAGTGSPLTSATTCDNAISPSNAIAYTHDLRNRPLTKTVPGSTNVGWDYFADGNLKTLTSGTGNTANVWNYAYNKRRLPMSEQLVIDGRTKTITHVYDGLGNENSVTYPSGLAVATNPNALGQPTQAGTYATAINYFANGGMSGFTYGINIVHTLTQNTRELPLRSLDQKPGSAAILDDTYSYDANGNVGAITDGTTGNPNNRSMLYDGLDRLTNTSAPHQWWITATTSYDPLDNIRQNVVGNRTYNYAYNPSSWRLSQLTRPDNSVAMTLGYDANGNVTSKGTGQDSYVFDAANRMTSVATKESYVYDGYGRRVKVTRLSDSKLDYPIYSMGGQLLTDDDQRSNTTTDYINLNGSLVAKNTAPIGTTTYTTTYEHTDALHSPISESSAAGTVIRVQRYTPYGEPSTYTQGPGFTGHVTDAATGLTYAQQRYYDPVIGRFLSVDPVQANDKGGNFNRYWYAGNNPYKFTDPDGRCFETTCDAWGDYVGRNPEEVKPLVPFAIAATAVMAMLSGAGEVVGMVKTAVMIKNALSDSPSATSRGVDTGELHAPGDVQSSTVIVRGGASEVPAGGTTYSGSQGATVAEAARGVPHGQIRATTAGTVRAAGGKVDVAPEPMKSGAINGQHVNVTEAPGTSSLGELQPTPVPKSDRLH